MPPDVVVILTDQERAAPPYETDELRAWRDRALPGRRWFAEHGVTFGRHYTGSLACPPSRPTLTESVNRWESVPGALRSRLTDRLRAERACQVPTRNQPWPDATRRSARVGS